MNSLLIRPSQKILSKSQETFNRLIKKIEKIQNNIKKTEAELNQGLHYYHSYVRPTQKIMVEKLSECIPIFYSYYTQPRLKLSKNEKGILKELIASLLSQLSNYVPVQDLNEEIIEIIKDIDGVNVKEVFKDEFDSLKKEIWEFAKQEGLDLDFSSINATDSEEEMKAKIQEAILKAKGNKQREEEEVVERSDVKEKVKKKTKLQLKKEQREREVEELHKKGLSKIYKQLARVLHPDLERDPLLKAEKEELMKKLTVAYDNQDLHTLLSLEITWMNRNAENENDSHVQADEQLKIYNALLKEQTKSLEEELNVLFRHPRYFDIQHLINGNSSSILDILENENCTLSSDFRRYSKAIIDLKDGSNFKGIKEILKAFSNPPNPDMVELIEMMKFFELMR